MVLNPYSLRNQASYIYMARCSKKIPFVTYLVCYSAGFLLSILSRQQEAEHDSLLMYVLGETAFKVERRR